MILRFLPGHLPRTCGPSCAPPGRGPTPPPTSSRSRPTGKIGQRIVEEEQHGRERADYGSFLNRNLARELGEEFGCGVSVANLWNFRQFYLTFPDEQILYALRRELTWTHWRTVMRVDSPAARDFYIDECAAQGWTTRQLGRAIAPPPCLTSVGPEVFASAALVQEVAP